MTAAAYDETRRVLEPGVTEATVTDHVSDLVLERKTPLWWWIGFGFSLSLLLLFVVSLAWLFTRGVWWWSGGGVSCGAAASGASVGRSPGGSRSATMSGGSAWRAAGPSSPP